MLQLELEFNGQVFVPTQPVNLPAGYKVTVSVEPEPTSAPTLPPGEKTALQKLADLAKQFPADPDDPTDLSIQHDHYLYGLPKKPL